MTLRRRLVLSIVALVVGVSLVIGAGSIAALATIQTNRIDGQLTSSTTRAQNFIDRPQGGGGYPGDGIIALGGQSAGTLTAVYVDGTLVRGGIIGDDGSVEHLTAAEGKSLANARVGIGAQTVGLGSGLGDFRVAAVSTSAGVLVVGLPMSPVYSSVWTLVWVVLAVTALALLVAIAVATLSVRRALRPLERVATTATTVARMPLDRGDALADIRVPTEDANPQTEVGRVAAAFNRMLGHIGEAMHARAQSEEKVRQFVADASHELRTPLASVRGYAELTRRMGADLPEDVVYAMSRIESESIRMTGMVEDLLLLARLDEGREIQFADVDLTGIVLDAVNDAHAASPEHHIAVELPDDPVVVLGDAARLHQVVVNLVTNARTHTPDGTSITVALAPVGVSARGGGVAGGGVGAAGGGAVGAVGGGGAAGVAGVDLSVRDDGQGIPPEFLPKLFERFARADSSRSRTAGSTGLGLAIVDAVVQAHGGRVEVRSVPGDTVFTVHLPAPVATDERSYAQPLAQG